MIPCAVISISLAALLLAGAASAADPKPTPEELWRSFPLDPGVTTPVPPPSTLPVPPQPANPGPVPEPLESGAGDRWGTLVLGGLAGSLLLVVSGGVLVATRRRRRVPAPAPMTREPRELIAEALALAREAANYDMLLHRQRLEGAIAMSERIPDQVVPANDETFSAANEATRKTTLSSYAEIGEHVAGVLSAAETAAERIRADARSEAEELVDQARREADEVRAKTTAYDSDTRAAVESYATERRREADQLERKQLADAEVQARATREAAEEMARDIEEAARQRGQALHEESRSVEERLQRAVQGLRRMTVQLEELLGAPTSPTAGASLADALKPAVREGDARQPLVALPRDDSR